MRGEADQPLYVERVRDLLDQLARLVDHGDVGVLAGQIARDIEADLAGAADDDYHGSGGSEWIPRHALSSQRRASAVCTGAPSEIGGASGRGRVWQYV